MYFHGYFGGNDPSPHRAIANFLDRFSQGSENLE